MENTTEILLGLIVVILSVFLIATIVMPTNIVIPTSEVKVVETAVPVYGGYVENINASCTHSYVSISSVVTGAATNEALAENYAASYRRIQNLGNTRAACSLDSSTSSLGLSQGIILYNSSTANSIYEISGNNLYQKEINCLAETATVTISVMECY